MEQRSGRGRGWSPQASGFIHGRAAVDALEPDGFQASPEREIGVRADTLPEGTIDSSRDELLQLRECVQELRSEVQEAVRGPRGRREVASKGVRRSGVA